MVDPSGPPILPIIMYFMILHTFRGANNSDMQLKKHFTFLRRPFTFWNENYLWSYQCCCSLLLLIIIYGANVENEWLFVFVAKNCCKSLWPIFCRTTAASILVKEILVNRFAESDKQEKNVKCVLLIQNTQKLSF